MAGSIAGKHLMDYVRAAKANQSGTATLIIMAVPDVHQFYFAEELANDPFKLNPGIIVGHDKVEVSKVQQVIVSSSKGTPICILLLDPSADTLQTWCAYEAMDILAYVMTNWPGTVIEHLKRIETLIQGIRGTAGLT
eukprot:8530266-Heterocapsa_arctica.AAC.1